MKKSYSFEFNGSLISENSYGHGRDDQFTEKTYLEDLWDLADVHVGCKTSNILEWGSGISTLMFADYLEQKKIGCITTLDDNCEYQESVIRNIENKKQVRAYCVDLIGPRESQSDICLNYSTLPIHFVDYFDLIYIDGRRRVECALSAALVSHENTVVVVHDYRRSRYQPMLAIFDCIIDGPHFRVMKIKSKIRDVFAEERGNLSTKMGADSDILFNSNSGSHWIKLVKGD